MTQDERKEVTNICIDRERERERERITFIAFLLILSSVCRSMKAVRKKQKGAEKIENADNTMTVDFVMHCQIDIRGALCKNCSTPQPNAYRLTLLQAQSPEKQQAADGSNIRSKSSHPALKSISRLLRDTGLIVNDLYCSFMETLWVKPHRFLFFGGGFLAGFFVPPPNFRGPANRANKSFGTGGVSPPPGR